MALNVRILLMNKILGIIKLHKLIQQHGIVVIIIIIQHLIIIYYNPPQIAN